MKLDILMAVGLGGALGAVLRYLVYTAVHGVLGRGFPYGSLVVNVSGSLAMGFVYVWTFDRFHVGPLWRAFLLVGLLGGFTTFSAFSVETLNLLEQGALARAALNVLLSVGVCVAAAWLGALAGRQI